MKETIKVSIIIPVYNVEKYLRQCLDSIINQTFKNFECICINDNSTDKSYSILEEYANKDNRFVIVNLSENKGQGNARNQGLKIAKGTYITFVDSDDWVTKDYLEKLYNATEKYNSDFVSAKFYLFDNTTNKTEINYREPKISFDTIVVTKNDRKKILKNINYLQTSTVCANMFKREFLLSKDMSFKMIKFEDTLFMWEAIIKATNFIFIKDMVYFYRTNRKNSTMTSFTVDDKIKYFSQLKKIVQQNFSDYISYCCTYILLSGVVLIEQMPLQESKLMFVKIRALFFDNNYNIDYSYTSYISKIKLFVFKVCLKFNLKNIFTCFSKTFHFFKILFFLLINKKRY